MSPYYGSIVVIKRSGQDGAVFSLIREECLLGRSEDCDIRIQLLDVSSEHARLEVDPVSKKVLMTSLGKNGVKVGDSSIPPGEKVTLQNKDLFQISDRFFRFESPEFPHVDGGRKRVSFGPVISPEYIDKSLPPSTPVKKGALPNNSALASTPLSHIKRRIAKLRGTTSLHETILEGQEEEKPVGVLVRHENDTPRIKESSGSRTSPRMDNTEEKKATFMSLSKNPSRFYGTSAAKTPKGAKKPLPKTPRKTPRKVSTKVVKTPARLKASAKKSWADVLKKNVGKTPRAIRVARETQLEDEKRRAQYGHKNNVNHKKSTKSKKTLESVLSRDRHAQSPEDIVIHRRRSIKANITVPKSPKTSMAKSSPLPVNKTKRQSVSPPKKTLEMAKRGRSKSVPSSIKSSNEGNQRRSITLNLKTDKLDDLLTSSVTCDKKRFSLAVIPTIEEAHATPTRLSRSPSKKLALSASKRSKSMELTPSLSKRGRPRGTKSQTELDSPLSKISKLSSPSPVRSHVKAPSSGRRGRPRKEQSPSKSSSEMKRSSSSSPTYNQQDMETPSTGRRGRPRKEQSPSKSSSEMKRASSSSPTYNQQDTKTPSSSKRGRPRKEQSPSKSSSEMKRTSLSSPAYNQQDIKTPSSGRRGRPRKEQSPSKSDSHSQTPSTPRGDRSSKTVLSSKKVNAKRSKSLSNLSISNHLKENDPRQSLSVQDMLVLNKNKRYSTPMAKIRKSFVKASPLSIASRDSSLESIILPTSSKTPANSPANGISPSNINRSLSKSLRESLGSFENSSFFDFDAVKTPNIPIQVLVSPLLSHSIQEEEGGALNSLRSKPATRMSLNTDAVREYHQVHRRRHSIDRIDMHDLRSPNKKTNTKILDKKKTRHVQKSPKSSYDNFVGIKELLKTPKKFEDMPLEGDLEALYASPEFNVLTSKKRESFLKKIQMANTVTSNRKLSLNNIKPKLSDVLKRRSLECNIDLFVSSRTVKSRISLDNANDEVENKSPVSIGDKSASKTVKNSKAKSKSSGKDKKALPTKLRERMDGDQTDFSVETVLETSSSNLNNLNEGISSSSSAENSSSKEELNDNEANLVTKDNVVEKEPKTKRSTRSKTVKKAVAEVPEVINTPPKRTTRSRNKSENEKTKISKVVQNDEETKSKPTPKRSARGRRNAKVDDDYSAEMLQLDSSKGTQKNSDSDEIEEKQAKKKSRTKKNEQLDTESVERPKTRGRRPELLEAASSDTSSPVQKTTRRKRKDQENAASEIELKQSDKSIEQSERGVQTNSSDSDEPTSSDQIRSLPKRSSRKNQKADTSKKSPAKRCTRSTRTQDAESKDPEVSKDISDKESTKVRKTRRGRHNSPQVAEVIESAPLTPKQRRTRRAAAKSPEVSTLLTKDKKSASDELVQAPTTRRGRKKKELSESSDDAPPKDESSGARTRRKRNITQSATTKETESSPAKRGRKVQKQEKSEDKDESPIKRVTRSRAKK